MRGTEKETPCAIGQVEQTMNGLRACLNYVLISSINSEKVRRER